jgi:hypothetical protein
MFWQKSQPAKSSDKNYVYFNEALEFPATKGKAIHTLAAYRIDSRTQYLLPAKSRGKGLIATALRNERRLERKALIDRLFYSDSPNFGISLSVQFASLPVRRLNLFNFGLRIEEPGYNFRIVKEICKFLVHIGNDTTANRSMYVAGMDVAEKDRLTSSHVLTEMFWLMAIVAKYADLTNVKR